MIATTRQERIPAIPLEMSYIRDEPAGARFVHEPVSKTGDVDTAALTMFLSTGMFLGTDTYFKDLRTVRPGEDLELDEAGMLVSRRQRFSWATQSASGELESRDACIGKLEALLEVATRDLGNNAVLAVSGGLDSRSLAASLSGRHLDLKSYSYAFKGGIDELKYGRQVSDVGGFNHTEFTIPDGYLWNNIERFPELTHCYAEFTHPRQMAVIDELAAMGDTFFLGHWGDVLFDDFSLPADAEIPLLAEFAFRRLSKSSGVWLAGELWKEHGLPGVFEEFFLDRLIAELEAIELSDANARMRAFKSIHWAPRWTSVNLSVFKAAGRLVVPYYAEEMCEFARSVPVSHLEGRQLQIEYIKRKSPALAALPWQAWAPFNLYNSKSLLGPLGIPVRIVDRLKRETRRVLGRPRVRQNWQNQFLGEENSGHLAGWLLESTELRDLVPLRLVEKAFGRFMENPGENWHSVSMLLTLAVFGKHKQRWIQRDG